jgi:hypothetical protein
MLLWHNFHKPTFSILEQRFPKRQKLSYLKFRIRPDFAL